MKAKLMLLENGLPPPPSLRSEVFLGSWDTIAASLPNSHRCPNPAQTDIWQKCRHQVAVTWNDRCQQSFNDLRHLCTMVPIHAHANFKFHIDAFGFGLGAVLYQTHDDGTDAVITYASRSLTKAETHYSAHKLEFLSLKWVVVEKFHEYLYGLTSNVYTNNNPLTYFLMKGKLDAASHHWVASLANYNFQLYYRAGKTNIDADVLLRVSWPRCMPKTLGTHH